MRIADWLHEPLAGMLLRTLLSGLAVSLMGAVLSVLVVLKRMSFIGQGVSHSAFGGIGIAALLAAFSPVAAASDTISFFIILAFCILAAIGMAGASDREALESDTAIGVFLVASMALGAALIAVAVHLKRGVTGAANWEAVLFGSVLATSRDFAYIAGAVSFLVLGVLWWARRSLVFWAFDEPAAQAFGVPTSRMKFFFVILLAIATVTAMRLAGVVFATALLVLPGAAALRLSTRLAPVMLLSGAIAVLGMVLGLLASIEADLPTGASVVLALTLLLGIAALIARARRRAGTPVAPSAGVA